MKTNILTMIKQAKVEWKPLGEVCSMITTGKLNANAMEDDGIYPFFTCNENPYRINEYAFDMEAILISGNGSQVGHINYYSGKFNAYQRTYVLGQFISEINIIYLVHYFKFCLKEYILVNSKKGSVPYITLPMLQNFQIPIPPLELQKEIVKILDKITELKTTLETEHILRKKQYHYYRDFLLSESELAKVGFEWRSLGEVTLPTQNIKWKNQDGLFKYIDLTSVDLQTHAITQTTDIGADTAPSRAQKLVATDDVIFATTRPTQMRLTIIPKEFNGQIASTGYCVLRADKSQILPKWIYFNLSANTFKVYLEENQSGSAYPAISDSKVKDFKIPIPPLDTQAKIVAILDKFDRLTSSITEGLPKEIELRRKQYEYYRELLLNFPKP